MLQEVAEQLLKDLQADIVKAEESIKMLNGAIQGVQVLFQRIQEADAKKEATVTETELDAE